MPAPAFQPDRIGEGYKPPSKIKKSNILRRYCHQKKRKEVDPHYQSYYQGRSCTDVTSILKPNLPGSPFKDPVFFPHISTDVTEIYEKAGKLLKRPATAPDYSHGVRCTDITELYRYIPPPHPGKDGSGIKLPYFGIRTSAVTDPSRYVDTSGLPLLSWWENQPNLRMPLRPQTALERRPFRRADHIVKKLSTPSEPPSSVPSTPRSQPGSLSVRSQPLSARSNQSMKSAAPSAKSDQSVQSARTEKSQSAKSQQSVKSQSAKSDKSLAKAEASSRNAAAPPIKTPRSDRSAPSHKSSAVASSGKPPKPPSYRNSLAGLSSLTAEALMKLGPEKMDRVTRWAGELQTWAVPEKRPPKPVYHESDHGRRKTDVTQTCVWS